jgi:hypothetical protein
MATTEKIPGTNFKTPRRAAKKKVSPKKSAAAAPARSTTTTARPKKSATAKPVKAKKLVQAVKKADKPIVPEVLPPIITVDSKPQSVSRTPHALAVVSDKGLVQIGRRAIDLIKEMPDMPDRELQSVLRGSIEVERAMWVVKGSAAHEVVKRATSEGSQFSKMKGMGLDSLIGQVATELGVNTFTLRDDYKAFAEFGNYIKEQLVESPESLMPREFYTLASKISEATAKVTPYEALQYFEEQRQAMGGEDKFTYYTDHARRDLKLFNQGHTIEQVRKLDGQARSEKIANKKNPDSVSQVRTISVQITTSEANQWYVRAIIEKHGSFTSWFEKTAKAEFGKFKEGN